MDNNKKSETTGVQSPVVPPEAGGNQNVELEAKIQAMESEKSELETKNLALTEDLAKKDEIILALEQEKKRLTEDLAKKGSKAKVDKGGPRFVVISPFRGNTKKDDGTIYDIGTDVSDFEEDRLANLISKELVQKV